MPVPQLLLYGASLFFLLAACYRTWRHWREPVHLRWELYPVAHEAGRAHYGGSHFETPEHWQAPRRVDHRGETAAMLREIVLLEGVRHHNRPLWRFSFPFHLGCYLAVVWLVLLGVLGVLRIEGGALVWALDLIGFGAMGLGFWGAAGLLRRRLSDPAMRPYNAPSDLFNLALWLVYFGWVIVAHAPRGSFDDLTVVTAAVVRLEPAVLTWPVAVEMVLGAVILAYLPLSRMFHFVAKYFLYHGVRWEDRPNPRGGPLERRLQQAMDFGVGWSAPHVGAGARWQDAASGVQKEDTP
jgi:nitrate reductase gamma subunit